MEEKIEYHGYTIEVVQDEDCESPDKWGNDDMFLVYDHRQFCVERKGYDPESIFQHIMETKKPMYEDYHVIPVYAYIHSGVALSLGSSFGQDPGGWDTSFRGFVLVKKMKGWSWRKDSARKCAKALIEEWNMYLSGDVYGVKLLDPEGDEVDACWGYYGEEGVKEAIAERKALADREIRNNLARRRDRLKQLIKARAPLEARWSIFRNWTHNLPYGFPVYKSA